MKILPQITVKKTQVDKQGVEKIVITNKASHWRAKTYSALSFGGINLFNLHGTFAVLFPLSTLLSSAII